MKQVIVASENPVKVEVAKRAFSLVFSGEEFEFVAVKSESEVPDQPMNEETEAGAHNRIEFIKAKYPQADYWVSQEGGLFDDGERLYNRAWIMVEDKTGYRAKASTAMFYLPKQVAVHVKEGMELGHAIDQYYGSSNSKQGVGGIGYITHGLIDRTAYYLQPAIIALSELKQADEY